MGLSRNRRTAKICNGSLIKQTVLKNLKPKKKKRTLFSIKRIRRQLRVKLKDTNFASIGKTWFQREVTKNKVKKKKSNS